MPLLTEALRGDGATLIDHAGHRFMADEHPDAELAPRDVVARAIWRQTDEGDGVFLDARHVGAAFPNRFPTVYAAAVAAGIDPRRRPLPVSPAAHYHMGGIAVDDAGRSSLPGLYACGEAAATGLHGANRLASNSLLEGLVYGTRVARAIEFGTSGSARRLTIPADAPGIGGVDDADAVEELRATMWRHVGVARTAPGLTEAHAAFERLAPTLNAGVVGRNMLTVASIITTAALRRTESRGGHFRGDYPTADRKQAESTVIRPEPAATHARPSDAEVA